MVLLLFFLGCMFGFADPPQEHNVTEKVTENITENITQQEWIRGHWNNARADYQWRMPNPESQVAISLTITELLSHAESCDTAALIQAQKELKEHHLFVEIHQENTETLWLIHEEKPMGIGLIAIRCGKAKPVILQAPHAIHDLWTGAIVRTLFVSTPFRMAMWNTVHRYRSTEGEQKKDTEHPADVSHNRDTVFHQLGSMVLNLNDEWRVAQLHGFEQDVPWDMIISHGTKKYQPEHFAESLKDQPYSIGQYGKDAITLGGTQNILAQDLNPHSEGRFLHIEMSLSLREQLRTDESLQKTLGKGLVSTQW
jgi:hypothetical protein